MDDVAAMLDAQLGRAPDATAVIDGDRRLTYRQLHERANHIACSLAAHGVTCETRVGVCCERTSEMIVAVVAIVKAGAAYVPIGPAYPPARRDAIVADAGLAAVVTQRHLAQQFAIPSVCADEAGDAAAAPAVALRGDDAMFVLYTSGSTGQPKGVVCTHAAVVNRPRWQQDMYPFAPGEIASARTTLDFVDSVAEIFAPIAFGVALVVIGDAAQRDPALAIAQLAATRATRIVLVPSLLAAMLDVMPDLADRAPALRYWFVGGEPVPVPLVERFRRALPGRKLVNIYGATELGSLAAIVAGFVLGARLGPALVAIAAAALWYTLVEYAMHRWLYHAGDSVMAVVHDWHHAEPEVMLGSPFYYSVSIWGLHGLAAGVVLGAPLGLVFGGTLLFSYGQQSLIHHAAHRYPRLDVLGARSALRRHHAIHHVVGDANFGVSTTLWDRVLGTYVTTSARRPAAPASRG